MKNTSHRLSTCGDKQPNGERSYVELSAVCIFLFVSHLLFGGMPCIQRHILGLSNTNIKVSATCLASLNSHGEEYALCQAKEVNNL